MRGQTGREFVMYDVSREGCEEWCVSHQDPVSGEHDGVCRSRIVEVGEHLLHLQEDAGQTVVRVRGQGRRHWMQLEDAPWLTQLMCSLLDAATTPAPAEQEAVGVAARLIGTSHQELAACLGVDLEDVSRRQAERMADVLALHGVAIAEN